MTNVSIKPGTNSLHGSAFEYFRNDKLNANNWGRNWSLAADPACGEKACRTPIRWNEFGGTLGGPIRRDMLSDYQGIRNATAPNVSTLTVMPADFRNGDFSRLLTEKGVQPYDPLTTDAYGIRQPFINNQIPVARRDIVATTGSSFQTARITFGVSVLV